MKASIIVDSSLRALIVWTEKDKILSQDRTGKKIPKGNCIRSTKCLNELRIKCLKGIVKAEDGPAWFVS